MLYIYIYNLIFNVMHLQDDNYKVNVLELGFINPLAGDGHKKDTQF